MKQLTLFVHSFPTPLGPMVAIGSEETLYLLEFQDRKNLKKEIDSLIKREKSNLAAKATKSTLFVEKELSEYFRGDRKTFSIPFAIEGSSFQRSVWDTLQTIPYGKRSSYLEIAQKIERPSACRAVANAVGQNQLAIIIPCHRILYANGEIGGYAGGLEKKRWLLNHENLSC